MALVLFTGGARSGKSSAAQDLARTRLADGVGVTVAVFGHTSEGQDFEYAERIRRHQADRPAGFHTQEYDGELHWLDTPRDELLLVDCLGTLLGRVMEGEWKRICPEDSLAEADNDVLPEGFEEACTERFDEIVTALRARAADTIVVTNQVGDGIVPFFASGRLFRDLLGRANRHLVDSADAAYLTVAGRLISLSALPRAAHWPHD